MLGAHPVQEGSGPCKIPNLSHLLWSYGTHLLARDEVNFSGHVQSKNGVDLVEVSIIHKSEKMSGQTIRLIKIKMVVLFYLIIAA